MAFAPGVDPGALTKPQELELIDAWRKYSDTLPIPRVAGPTRSAMLRERARQVFADLGTSRPACIATAAQLELVAEHLSSTYGASVHGYVPVPANLVLLVVTRGDDPGTYAVTLCNAGRIAPRARPAMHAHPRKRAR